MRLLECLLVANNCYKKYHTSILPPTGIIVHSTDKAGGVLKRFVQPSSNQVTGMRDGEESVTNAEMIQILGKNVNGNSWNRPEAQGAVHAAIGKVADGSYAVCKTLDYTQPCWGVAFGTKGSYDGRKKTSGGIVPASPLYVQFEMIEDGENPSKEHCKKLYDNAVDFCAYLCKLFPSIKIENVISHKEANARGYGSAHGDPEAYWKRVGVSYTMDGFRKDVKKKIAGDTPQGDTLYEVKVGSFRNRVYAEAYLEEVKRAYPNAYITTKTTN